MMDFLRKILGGFALGLGFAVAALAVAYISIGVMVEKLAEDLNAETEKQLYVGTGYQRFSEDSGLKIKSHRERKTKNGVEILAEVENAGGSTWSSVSVEVEFFNQQNQFIDECSDYIERNLAPRQIENIKLKCGGCGNNPLPAYSRYTIRVVSASSY